MGAVLLIPFIFIRFVLLFWLDKGAVSRAAHFAPMVGKERIALWIYQISNIAIIVYLFFVSIKPSPKLVFASGIALYALGSVLLIASVVYFAKSPEGGIIKRGVYNISRNPMYLAYFLFFIGCALLVQSLVLLVLTLIFQVSAHWIILSEERWCRENFGGEYEEYAKKVRRYI